MVHPVNISKSKSLDTEDEMEDEGEISQISLWGNDRLMAKGSSTGSKSLSCHVPFFLLLGIVDNANRYWSGGRPH